jgi:hypothetical protein
MCFQTIWVYSDLMNKSDFKLFEYSVYFVSGSLVKSIICISVTSK